MKRNKTFFVVTLLLVTVILSLGCSNQSTSESDIYMSMAQKHIDNGDYTSAIMILEEGITATDSPNLKVMLVDVQDMAKAGTSADSETIDNDKSADTSPSETLDSGEDDDIDFGDRPSDFYDPYDNDISVDPATNYYYNDNNTNYEVDRIAINPKHVYWDGTVLVAECFVINGYSQTVNNINVQSFSIGNDYDVIASANFGILNGLQLEPYTYAVWTLKFTSGVYRDGTDITSIYWSSQVSCDIVTQTYDMTKASGILASMGMTETEFRNSCTYMGSEYDEYNEYTVPVGRQYYSDHPEENILLDNYTKDWEDYVINGRNSDRYDQYNKYDLDNSNSLDDYLNRQIYGPKGAKILGEKSIEIANEMVEYPGNYIGQCFLLKDFTADNINNYVYSCDYFLPWTFSSDSFVIYDYRDNKSSPTIIENESYDMYVIFLGNKMLYNEINLEFALISLDKCE